MSTTVLIGQAPTNLGPLTATFTPPPACTVAVGVGGGLLGGLLGDGDRDVAWLGQTCSRGNTVDAIACWPPASKGIEQPEPPLHGWGFYSPGLHCPVGYATACSATGGSGRGFGWPVQFELRDGETAVGCCPNGYGCANINGQTCTMIATSTTIPTVTCDGNKSGDFASQTIPDAKASITALSLFAPMIQINWQSSDRPASTLHPSSSNTTPPAVTPSGTQTIDTEASSSPETLILDLSPQTASYNLGDASTPSSTPSQQDHNSQSSNNTTNHERFSPGTKVAIGVAGAAAVLMLLVCALFYCWRRRKNRREELELDRLCGVKSGNARTAGGDFTSSGDIPGWYRGQRLETPTKDAFGSANGPNGVGGVREVGVPAGAYFRGYRG
ncbi:hypothetical protein VTI74DRAFT_3038 [Chaetomium olivicolor]